MVFRFITPAVFGPVGRLLASLCVMALSLPLSAAAQGARLPARGLAQEADFDPLKLNCLPLEHLLDVEITFISRKPAPLLRAPSLVDLVTAEAIWRTCVTNLPGALRQAVGLHGAQFDGHNWPVSSRGFNNVTAKEMQELMEGRNLYAPLYAGMFWGLQYAFMPDVERSVYLMSPCCF